MSADKEPGVEAAVETLRRHIAKRPAAYRGPLFDALNVLAAAAALRSELERAREDALTPGEAAALSLFEGVYYPDETAAKLKRIAVRTSNKEPSNG